MRLSSRRRHAARRRPIFGSPLSILAISSLAASPSGAITFTPAPSANLDLSQLGRVGVAGDFTGISLFQYKEQSETLYTNNGTESLLARLPNGAFASVAETDASILAMCDFTSSGTETGVLLGGNFTSFGGQESPGIAMFNPNTSAITPITGLSGQVNALLCDSDTNSVYVGGNFRGANSTNALKWTESTGLTNLPFAGFNGPVTSISKTSSGNIIFGGSFSGLGNATTPSTPDGQIINLSTANVSSGSSSATAGFSDPRNIICKTNGTDGANSTWLLEDNTAGFWQATFGFGFQPSKLRLYNTHQDGRGTQTWRFTALPINGIMNFTYLDPATGANKTCTSECPLSSNSSLEYQEFHFVNTVGMNSFRIDISAWYGSGGGLNGIELFENDIFAYAIDDFNEPTCAGLSFRSAATKTGNWVVTPSGSSTSNYLSVVIPSPISSTAASIVFEPDIRQSGQYSVNVYTPGCVQDNSCSTRGQFNITGTMTSTGGQSFSSTLFQTNNYDKYDQVFYGHIDASSNSFRPQVTLTPVAGQNLPNMTFVAQKIGFTLINSTGGLTGLFEYDPSSGSVNLSDFTTSAIDVLGASFDAGSAVNTLATSGDVTFIGGNFTFANASNAVALNSNTKAQETLGGGLNGQVLTMALNGTQLFVGGDFTNVQANTSTGLNHVAVYDTSTNSWGAMGAGVNGKVVRVVLMTMNVTSTTPEVVVSVNGDFTLLEAFGSNAAVSVSGFGIWVPSEGNWLQNLNITTETIMGVLSSSLLNIDGGQSFYAGSLSSSTVGANGVVELTSSTSLSKFPVDIESTKTSSSSLTKRDATLSNSTINGVVTGLFDTTNNRNNTILAGHFTATATNGSTINNLLILDGSSTVTGFSSQVSTDSTFVALAVTGNTLFAGGNVTGTINGNDIKGLVTYNLATGSFNTQPPSLAGGNATVSTIAIRPNTGDVYVGGNFSSAGSLGCPGVCFFSTTASQWNQPGTNLAGSVNSMIWTGTSTLVAGGNFLVNTTSVSFLVTYDASNQVWDSFSGANQLPGPVDVITAANSDNSQLWVSGTATNGSVYFMKYDGTTWSTPGVTLSSGSVLRDLQVLSLTESHDSTDIMDANQVLLLTGALELPGYGAAAAATFNGTAFTPFLLTSNAAANTVGSVARIFVENSNFFASSSSHLPLGFVVLIGLGISLALMFLIVVAGLLLDRLRKRREGYVPAPTSMYDRGSGLQRIPPQELLEELGRNRVSAVPHV